MLVNTSTIIETGYAIGTSLILYAGYGMYKMFKTSVVIPRRQFRKIENNIRKDEREKVIKLFNKKEV